VGATGTSGAGFIAPVALFRGYSLNPDPARFQQVVHVRIYHRGHSWIEKGIRLVRPGRLNLHLVWLNLSYLGVRSMLLVLIIYLFCYALYFYALDRRPFLLFLALASLSTAVGGMLSVLLTMVLPFTLVLRLFPLFEMASVVFLVLATWEYLLESSSAVLLPVVGMLMLAGMAGLVIGRFDTLYALRAIQYGAFAAGILVAAGIAAAGLRRRKVAAIPVFVLFLVAAAVLAMPFRDSLGWAYMLQANYRLEFVLALLVAWITAFERWRGNREFQMSTRALEDRLRADQEMLARIREGKSRLENRNLESMILASRLLESAQRQAFTAGQIMRSIGQSAEAEGEVVGKEREIRNLTVEVDSHISGFSRELALALKGLEELERRAQSITQAVAQIIGIADKTHLLSLNASIEASKAGEAGRGFAVVAQRIRKLAEVTRSVSDQISALIQESNQAIGANVQAAQRMEQGYRQIITQSERIRSMIEQNSAALEEVTRAHAQVKDGLAEVDRTIKTILEVSRDLRQMTSNLGNAFSWFDEVLKVTGTEVEATATPAAPAAGTTRPAPERLAEPFPEIDGRELAREASTREPHLGNRLELLEMGITEAAAEPEPAELEPLEREEAEEPAELLPAGPEPVSAAAPVQPADEGIEELETIEDED
jgi:methyl-accepting chemotaxis protein